MKRPPINLEKQIHPIVASLYRESQEEIDLFSEHWYDAANHAEIFDCRDLSRQFAINTGEAAMPESFELHQPWHLPYESCFFIFDDGTIILAMGTGYVIQNDEEWDVEGIDFRVFSPSFKLLPTGKHDTNFIYGRFQNADDRIPWILDIASTNNNHYGTKEDRENVETGAYLLTGVLTLLNEHLVATEVKPDPAPALTRARAKKGLPPATAETHVLTINTAAVRRIAGETKLKSHESPRLHWRRGHWRILHRFSEFEDRVWVRRCLVGDPDRGYVDKDYKLTWTPPMLH